jgi:hypothetical protein
MLSRLDETRLQFIDVNGEPYVMVFKKGSTIAYGDGNLYYKDEDVLSLNPDI